MSGKCRDCVHWGGYGSAGKEPIAGWRTCALSESASGKKQRADSLMVAIDCEGFAADLFTAADFGCVQFEGKEDG